MKKVTLLCVAILSVFCARAQNAVGTKPWTMRVDVPQTLSKVKRHAAKTTTVTIASETFGTGTDTTLPTGWTSGSFNGSGNWRWTEVPSSSPNSIGAMNSTTFSDGWMIFDADSINNDCSCSPGAWLQSPAYNCAAHSTVRLNFEEYYGHVFDTTEVWVSTDPSFSTYTVYPLPLNDGIDFGNTTNNTQLMHINISSAAAGNPAVYIRFVFRGEDFFDLSWMVDDMTLTELEPYDAGIAKTFMFHPDPSSFNTSLFTTPLAFIDSFGPGGQLSNYGFNAATGMPVTANIYQGTTSVYSQTIPYPSLPVNATDSLMMFPPFKPAATGDYTAAFSTGLTGDADPTNNFDTVHFSVTDTIWMQNDTAVGTNFFVNIATFGPPSSSMLGTRFDVPSNAPGDTVSGFGIAFSPLSHATSPGASVKVQLYSRHKGDTSWTYEGTSVSRALTASDLSTFTSTKWVDFRIDTGASGGVSHFVLHPGTSYIAMLQTDLVNTDLLVFASNLRHIPGVNGAFAYGDTSHNDGNPTFHEHPGDTGIVGFVPFIRMYFGPAPADRTGVNSISRLGSEGVPYPDPANNTVTIPFTVAEDASVKISIYNMAGQQVKTQSVNATGGKQLRATFTITDLPEGVYNYNIEALGQRIGGRLVVAH